MTASHVIDRRLNGKNKSSVNRERFLRRYREHIRKAVAESVGQRSITDMDHGESIGIPSKDISEPTFHHGRGGKRETVNPGNREYSSGDRLSRPPGGAGSGSGSGDASNSGEGMDEFVFQISQEEFLDFMFEDLALPNLVKKQLKNATSYKYVKAGFTNKGIPAKINIIRSLRGAYGRRLALTGKHREKIRQLKEEIEQLESLSSDLNDPSCDTQKQILLLQDEIAKVKERIQKVPWIDEFDLKFNQHIRQPIPSTSAVMFCLMDVSGSMTQQHKDIAKRFFILLYLFLKRNYEKIEVVFIRHHTSAKEVDEESFFYSRETGGTIVSSALKLMKKIMHDRYPASDWNIYAAQASDGDNWNDDSPLCSQILKESILPYVQYFSYIEITPHDHQMLWHQYEQLSKEFGDAFVMQQIIEAADIYPVFRKLFQRKPA